MTIITNIKKKMSDEKKFSPTSLFEYNLLDKLKNLELVQSQTVKVI